MLRLIAVVAVGLTCIGQLFGQYQTGRGQVQSITGPQISTNPVVPILAPTGNSERVSFEFATSSWLRLKVDAPRFLSPGVLTERTLRLDDPSVVEITASGDLPGRQPVRIFLNAGSTQCEDTQTFNSGLINFVLRCNLREMTAFGDVLSGIADGSWYIEVSGSGAIRYSGQLRYRFPLSSPDVKIEKSIAVSVVGDDPGMITIGRTTLVRALLRNIGTGGNVTGVRGVLRVPGRREPIEATNSGAAIAPMGPPDPNDHNHSLNFIIPAELVDGVTGVLPVEIEVSIPGTEANRANNKENPAFRLHDSDFFNRKPTVFAYWATCVDDVCPNLDQFDAHTKAMAMLPMPERTVTFLPMHFRLPPIRLYKLETDKDRSKAEVALRVLSRMVKPVVAEWLGQSDNYFNLIPMFPASVSGKEPFGLEKPALFEYCPLAAENTSGCSNLTRSSFGEYMISRFAGEQGAPGTYASTAITCE